MSDILSAENNAVTRVKTEDGKLYVHTKFYDDENLEQNKRLRNSGMFDGRLKSEMHHNEDVRMMISCPSVEQWLVFQKKHPDIYKDLKAGDEATRMKGARRLHLIKPEWVIFSRL
jgi:hypothetical protein